jgi:hypothetical protein
LFIKFTQSYKSGTVITNPYPEDKRSTLETLFRNLLIKACAKANLYCCEMNVFLSKTNGDE